MLSKIQRASSLGSAAKRRNAARGRKAVAVVLRMKARIEKSFYAMGVALKTLEDPAVFRALGHSSFSQLCTTLGTSAGAAERLIHIVDSFTQRDAKNLTSTKATAIIDLARAVGGKTTPKGLLAHGTIHLPTGDVIDVHSADATAIDRAAKRLRERAPRKHRGGLGISKEAAAFFKRLDRELRSAKAAGVRIERLAASKAAGGTMRIVAGVGDADKLGHALIRASKPR